jgi:methanogenic corrinoid protein MtbC1
MMDFDEHTFNHILSNAILRLGFEKCMLQIVYPFLEKIGKLWQASSICIAQEHFVSNLLRQKIMAAIDGQVIKDPDNSTRALLFCPPGELHELNLMFVNYVLRSRNIHTLYLGTDLPLCDLSNIEESYKPDFFIMAFTAGYAQRNQDELKAQLKAQLSHIPGFVIGAQCSNMTDWPENIRQASSFEEIESHLNAKV